MATAVSSKMSRCCSGAEKYLQGATPRSKQMKRERERGRERDGESNHDRCTIPVEKYKVRNPALVPLFVLTAKQKLKWSHLIHSEKWYRLYGQAPYALAYQTSHLFFCFASQNQKRLKQAEVIENCEQTKQHHNFVTLPRANETPILRLSCCPHCGGKFEERNINLTVQTAPRQIPA